MRAELNEQARFLVSPRHLAGTGDRLADVLSPLIHLFEWPRTHDPETGDIALDSPCGTVLVDFSPSSPAGTWWTITHHDPYWKVTATRQTPLEALAGITRALPQLLGDSRHADRIPLATRSVSDLADLYGWTAEPGSYTSPDGHCTVHHAADQPWRVEHSVYDGFDTHWSVRTEGEVPDQLPAQFFTYLASPDPVERVLADVPYLARSRAQLTPLASHRPGLGAHVVHALGGLAASLDGRRQ
ncbi:DUF317 domain-containing protein [Streptomyces sp. NPDC054835]|uniref:DUF317 domain-containing protein n=1 Tax=Streptomyces exfoliatus TaxID=1905 RepID=UPI000466BAB7|nr:DUF317 domain-containing protein [Streptomyces exfoliatus]